jgi:hypothetical protein
MSASATEILFHTDGSIELLPDSLVVDFKSTVQRSLVNCLIAEGSDTVFPQRGIDLLTRAIGGSLLNQRAAQHAGNYAASDTLFFGREHDMIDAPFKLAVMELEVTTLSIDLLELYASFLSVGGENVSFPITNALTV